MQLYYRRTISLCRRSICKNLVEASVPTRNASTVAHLGDILGAKFAIAQRLIKNITFVTTPLTHHPKLFSEPKNACRNALFMQRDVVRNQLANQVWAYTPQRPCAGKWRETRMGFAVWGWPLARCSLWEREKLCQISIITRSSQV